MNAPSPDTAVAHLHRREAVERLWPAFMTARAGIALALLIVVLVGFTLGLSVPIWLILMLTAYMLSSMVARIGLAWYRAAVQQERLPDNLWLVMTCVDVLVYACVQVYDAMSINYMTLCALPVLMAAVLGTRRQTLGIAAGATLLQLTMAFWDIAEQLQDVTPDAVQAGVRAGALMLLAWLTQLLVSRLQGEAHDARLNRDEARTLTLVNTLVIEHLSDGVLVVEPDLRVLAANPAARTMLGLSGVEPLRSLRLTDAPAWQPLVEYARQTLAGHPVEQTEIVLSGAQAPGLRMLLRTQNTPRLGDSERQLCVLFLQDLREAEARLRTEKLAAMGRLSAAMAHEIRNPLAAISQATALLVEDLGDDPLQRRLTDIVRQNTQRLGAIVDDVLDVARVQQLRAAPASASLPLDGSVRRLTDEWVTQHAAGSVVALSLQAGDALIRFSPEHLRRVLVNLLDNAWRYAGRAAAAIRIDTCSTAEGRLMLSVWSTGAALDPTVQRHLFEPFFSSESRSTGLGLYMCRELCARHGAALAYRRTARPAPAGPIDGNDFFILFAVPDQPAPRHRLVAPIPNPT